MRLMAAAAVVGFHYMFFDSTTDPMRAHTGFHDPGGVFHYGNLGVPVFFIISGFVILNSAWNRTPVGFLAARVGRLYPLFWAACTISAIVMAVEPSNIFDMSIRQWLLNFSMFSQLYGVDYVDGVYWTLTIELAFYLMIFAFVKIGITTNRVIGFCLGWLAVNVLAIALTPPDWLNKLLVPHWACYFVTGMLFALIAHNGWRRRYVLPLIAAYGVSAVSALQYFSGINAQRYGVDYNPLIVLGVITATFAIFAAICSGARLPGAQWIAVVGGLTYPLYLVHENIGFVGFETLHHDLGLNRWLVLGVVLGTVVGLAWLLHVAVENRFAKPLADLINNTWISLRATAREHQIPILSRE